MSPEEPGNLVVANTWLDGDQLWATVERVYSQKEFLVVSWYARLPPDGALAIGGGAAYVYDAQQLEVKGPVEVSVPGYAGDYFWRDKARGDGLMFIMLLPPGHTIVDPRPMLREAKRFEDRVAVYWKPDEMFGADVLLRWQLAEIDDDVDSAVKMINHIILDAERVPSNIGVNVDDVQEANLEARQKLWRLLVELFSDEELNDICFELGIDQESLAPGNKRVKAREMVLYLQRRDRLEKLVDLGRRERPNREWPIFTTT